MNEVYLDNASTTRPDPQVLDAMVAAYGQALGNASSIHRSGVKAARQIEIARQRIAQAIHAEPEEIVFTGSGTESNHLALIGTCLARRDRGDQLVVSAIEHPSVLAVADHLAAQGIRVIRLGVDSEGRVSPAELRRVLNERTLLVSVMHANNEVGTVQDIAALAGLCGDRGVPFHTDACQSFTKLPIDVRSQKADLITLSAHKIHGPRGVAALFVRRGLIVEPFMRGGGQESGLRSGTYNTEAIVGFGVAAEKASFEDAERMSGLRDELISAVLARFPGTVLNGPGQGRLCNNANFTVPGVSSKRLLFGLDRLGIFVSVGSACASGKKTPSHVLLAMGRDEEAAAESLRVSLSKWTTREETSRLVEALADVVREEKRSALVAERTA